MNLLFFGFRLAVKAIWIPVNSTITVTFNEAMDVSTINTDTFLMHNGVSGKADYDSATNIAPFTPASALSGNTTYNVTITTDVKDVAGNSVTGLSCSFTTEALAMPGNITAFLTSAQGNGNLSTWPDAGRNTGITAEDVRCRAKDTGRRTPKCRKVQGMVV